jgi:hypothetical protein
MHEKIIYIIIYSLFKALTIFFIQLYFSKFQNKEMNKSRIKTNNCRTIEKAGYSGAVNKNLLDYTWSIKLSHSFEIKPKPKRIPRFKQALKVLRPGLR